MLTIHVWPKRLKEFLLTHTLYKSPRKQGFTGEFDGISRAVIRLYA